MCQITKSPSYLVRNPYSYCFRMNVPNDLQPIIRKKEIRRSLKTGNLRIAKMKAWLIDGHLHEIFNYFRNKSDMNHNTYPYDQVEALLDQAFRSKLHFREGIRAHFAPPTTRDELQNERFGHEKSLENAKESLALNDYALVRDDVLKTFVDTEFSLEPDTPEFNRVCRMLLKRKIRYHEIELARLEGDFSTNIEHVFHADIDIENAKERQDEHDRITKEQQLVDAEWQESLSALRNELAAIKNLTGNVTTLSGEEEPSILLSELWERFKAEKVRRKEWRGGTIRNHEPKYRALLQFVGDVPVNQITKGMIRDFRALLDRLPPHFVRRGYPDLTGISPDDLKGKHEKTMDISTIGTYMILISSMFGYAVEYDYVKINPVTKGMIPKKKRNAQVQRHPFSDPDDLARIFDEKLFLKWSKDRPERFWVPLISLFTGCRLEEATQLRAEDIKEVDGYWSFDFKGGYVADDEAEEEGQMVKNESAPRIIPMHSLLVDHLKLPEYAKFISRLPGQLLFPHLTKGPKTNFKYSHGLSKDFSRYLRNKVRIKDEKKTLHSLRHSMTDHLKNKMVSEWMIEELEGRAGKTETSRRYSGQFRVPKIWDEAISKINFEVDLSHLKESKYVPSDPNTTSQP